MGLLHMDFVVCSTDRHGPITHGLYCLFYRQAWVYYTLTLLFVLQIGMGLLHMDFVVCSTDRHGSIICRTNNKVNV